MRLTLSGAFSTSVSSVAPASTGAIQEAKSALVRPGSCKSALVIFDGARTSSQR